MTVVCSTYWYSMAYLVPSYAVDSQHQYRLATTYHLCTGHTLSHCAEVNLNI